MPTPADEQLMQAAYQGNLSAINEALAQGAEINAQGPFGDTALNEAAEQGHFEIVERLLEAGADLENLGGADKTPIMNAAFAGHVEIVAAGEPEELAELKAALHKGSRGSRVDAVLEDELVESEGSQLGPFEIEGAW